MSKASLVQIMGILLVASAVASQAAGKNIFPANNPNNFYSLPGYDSKYDTLYPGNIGYNPRFPPFNFAPDAADDQDAERKLIGITINPYGPYNGGNNNNGGQVIHKKPKHKKQDGNHNYPSWPVPNIPKPRPRPQPRPRPIQCLPVPKFGNPAVLVSTFLANLNFNLSTSSNWKIVYQNKSATQVYSYIFSLTISTSVHYFGISYNGCANQVINFGFSATFTQITVILGVQCAAPIPNIANCNLQCSYCGKCGAWEGFSVYVGSTQNSN